MKTTRPAGQQVGAPRETSPCAPPPGGWQVVDDAKATRAALVRAMALADSAYGAGGAAEVWAATDELRRTLDARFGPGAVKLIPFLEPV